jgi:putative hydrolase of HD superfamily
VSESSLLEFFHRAGRLKGIERTGWIESGVGSPESVADHGYRTALMALIIAEAEGLDPLKAVRMALIHDLAEVETGDLTPAQKRLEGEAHSRAEEAAMRRLLRLLPGELAASFTELWHEYERLASPEARLVHEVDRLEMLLQASEYEGSGVGPSKLERFWRVEVGGGLTSDLADDVRRKRG